MRGRTASSFPVAAAKTATLACGRRSGRFLDSARLNERVKIATAVVAVPAIAAVAAVPVVVIIAAVVVATASFHARRRPNAAASSRTHVSSVLAAFVGVLPGLRCILTHTLGQERVVV